MLNAVSEDQIIEYELGKLSLKRGDTLVVSVPSLSMLYSSKIGRERLKIFKKRFTSAVPRGVKVLLADRVETFSFHPQGGRVST
jgi:hypothetical protein